MAEAGEAENLAATCERSQELVSLLSGQLAVLRTQAQTFLGIAGICISVTGFAGHNMVNAGLPSALAMIVGVAFILVAIVITIRCLSSVRWVTQDLGHGNVELARRVIARRDRLLRKLNLAAALIAVGLACYLVAVMLAALTKGGWTPP
ncbi:MAG: hypothetical protein HYZ29_33985 [Myxococcales bacterium]|nr:hypothetical protein [Myxococcales bacterium]